MSEFINLSRVSFVRLLDAMVNQSIDELGFPNPEETVRPRKPFPNPGDPVLQQALIDLSRILEPHPDPWRTRFTVRAALDSILDWVALNPQPLPPKTKPQQKIWRAALIAQAVVNQALLQYRQVQLVADGEKGLNVIRTFISEYVDDFCGTRPFPFPFPFPFPGPDPRYLGQEQVQPLGLLVIGAQFQKAADYVKDDGLRSIFSAAADQLFETGLERIANAKENSTSY
jgi:hypothetical protein